VPDEGLPYQLVPDKGSLSQLGADKDPKGSLTWSRTARFVN